MKINGKPILLSLFTCLLSFETASAGPNWFHVGEWGWSHWGPEFCHWFGWCSDVCYSDLGCFEKSLECHQSFYPPMTPKEIMTTFHISTRNHESPIIVEGHQNISGMEDLRLNETDGVAVIIHGWGESHREDWVMELSKAMLRELQLTIVRVDWYEGADAINYKKSVQNIRVVGREVALFIKALSDVTHFNLTDFHIIGHSLGAHAAGYAGEHLPGIGRITALDAVGPAFVGTGPECRLDDSDALFVDAIHTDSPSYEGNGIGIAEKVGDCDFYPNGGHDQPGCRFWQPTCNHARSYAYFTESLTSSCQFESHLCSNETNCLRGETEPCTDTLPSMGYYASANATKGSFYLKTHQRSPFCVKYRSKTGPLTSTELPTND